MLTPRYYFADDFRAFHDYFLAQPHKETVFRKGELLWKPGQPYDRLNYFLSGAAVHFAEHETGRRRIISFHGPGTVFPGYFNEEGVGEAVAQCGIPREELFLTDKVWISSGGYEKAVASIDASLKKLRTDYIDLMLVHQPFNDYYGTWRALEEAYRAGKLRAIGVSNFMPDRFIDLCGFVDIAPMVNQLEVHVFQQQRTIRPYLEKHGTQLMAWSPLAQGRNGLFTDPTLQKIGARYGKTAAQVNLRFLMQSGVVVIPKSTHRERMAENFDLFDFRLTDEEMEQLQAMDLGRSQFIDHYAPDVAEMFVGAGSV